MRGEGEQGRCCLDKRSAVLSRLSSAKAEGGIGLFWICFELPPPPNMFVEGGVVRREYVFVR